jgi:hypothetical protein
MLQALTKVVASEAHFAPLVLPNQWSATYNTSSIQHHIPSSIADIVFICGAALALSPCSCTLSTCTALPPPLALTVQPRHTPPTTPRRSAQRHTKVSTELNTGVRTSAVYAACSLSFLLLCGCQLCELLSFCRTSAAEPSKMPRKVSSMRDHTCTSEQASPECPLSSAAVCVCVLGWMWVDGACECRSRASSVES